MFWCDENCRCKQRDSKLHDIMFTSIIFQADLTKRHSAAPRDLTIPNSVNSDTPNTFICYVDDDDDYDHTASTCAVNDENAADAVAAYEDYNANANEGEEEEDDDDV
ncbi:hypothetical protein DPMN_043077 [Dreissena polymorpha]|uniref:Uncharacterized protein n=1 Tax=Dreissena polymorpha TaxID=45954 RepID=A0A9D4HXK5_DREPO|nr:hypothetical protein DPMN_043077 [Dreissena polymorpha]